MGHSLVRKTVLDHPAMYPSIQPQTLHSVYESGERQKRCENKPCFLNRSEAFFFKNDL